MQSRFVVFIFVVFIVKEKKGESLAEICIFCVRFIQNFYASMSGKLVCSISFLSVADFLKKRIKYTKYMKSTWIKSRITAGF